MVPECLTISITMSQGRPVVIEQVAGHRNKQPSSEARGMIDSWFGQVLNEYKS